MRTYAQTRFIALAAGFMILACSPLRADQETRTDKAPPGRAARDQQRSRGRQTPSAADSVRLHFEIVELKLSAEQLYDINSSGKQVDVEALTADGAKNGQAAIKYVFDHPVVVGQTARMITGARVPVRNVSRSDSGAGHVRISYEDVGCIVDVASSWVDADKRDQIAASWGVEVSALIVDTPIEGGGEVSAPVFMQFEQRFTTVCHVGSQTSFSMLSSHQMDSDEAGSAVAYICRVRFDPISAN